MLPIYFIYHYIPTKITIFTLISFTLALPFIFPLLLNNNPYAYYLLNNENFKGGSYVRFFYIGMYLMLLFIAFKKNLLSETKQQFAVLLPAFFTPFWFGSHLGGRLSSYFYLFFILLIPQIISQCNRYFKIVFMIMLSLFFFAYLYVSKIASDKSPYIPYQTIFTVDLQHPQFK